MSSLSEELVKIAEQGEAAVLVTVVEVQGDGQIQPGAKCLIRDGKAQVETIGDANVVAALVRESDSHARAEKSQLVSLAIPDSTIKLEAFFEVMPAPPRLIVVGAGHIAVPLVKIAKVLDFHVTVIDDRLLYANRERFPDADEVLTGDMAQMLKEMTLTPSCYIVLDYPRSCLRRALPAQHYSQQSQVHRHDRQPATHQGVLSAFPRRRESYRGGDRAHLRAHRPRHRHRNAGGNRCVDSRRGDQDSARR